MVSASHSLGCSSNGVIDSAGIIIFFLLIGLIAVCFIYNDSLNGLKYNGYILSFAVSIFFLMLFAFYISYKINESGSSKYLSTIIPTTQHHRRAEMANAVSSNCLDNRRHHPPGYSSGPGGVSCTAAAAGTGATSLSSANPCPVPGCNYGKVISN